MKFFRSLDGSAIMLVGIVILAVPSAAWPQASGGRTVLDAVYTAAQAAHGESLYKANCSTCHGLDLEGGQGAGRAIKLRTDLFIDHWREDNLRPLFERIKAPMGVQGETATLPESDFIAILAYLLQQNDFPAGSEELTAANLGAIRMTAKDGPKPLPNNSKVATVGCLAGSDGDWTLSRAAEPVRKSKLETAPVEVLAFKDMALGTITFQLRNVDLMDPPFDVAPHNGHKMLVQGVMVNDPRSRRMTPLAMVMLGACP